MRTSPELRWIPAAILLVAGAYGCNSVDDSSLSREPLARATPVAPAGGSHRDEDSAKSDKKAEPAPKRSEPTAKAEPPPQEPSSDRSDEPERKAKKSPKKSRASASPGAEATGGLTLKRLVVTSAIEHREPVATSTFRATGDPIIAFVELANPGDDPESIGITFENATGRKVGDVKLEIPAHARRWRTWGRTRLIRRPGSWTAVVKDESGRVLARQSFAVSK